MDGFYRGIESSLLALSLVLVVAVAAVSSPFVSPAQRGIETTLPMITVTGEAPGE